jgi:hypothetical protein
MPLPPKKSDPELYALCREIYERDGAVTANRLRDAAGGGGYNRRPGDHDQPAPGGGD